MQVQATYWGNIATSFRTLWKGLMLTFRHFRGSVRTHKTRPIQHPQYFDHQEGIATIQYPHEQIPVPDNGRYRLHNEIDDCIVCDKCAKICPVDCITIEPIKATEEIGRTSDGTPKRIYAARFDIDMGKCCFCGLCTTVCPTECLTMTKVYDFSVFDIRDHVYAFGDMTEADILDKKKLLEQQQQAKAAAATTGTPAPAATASPETPAAAPDTKPARPVFKPRIKPPGNA
jgi:formate hydrogenlyase subunit 6/NADH:ubiquinone oxidoreductase subunit I